MNFRKIIDQMDQLNQREKQIRKKYARKRNIENVYHPSLKGSEEDQDLFIYGYTNEDIVEHFRKKQQVNNRTISTVQRVKSAIPSCLKDRRSLRRSKTAKIQREHKNYEQKLEKRSYNGTPQEKSFCEHYQVNQNKSEELLKMFKVKANSIKNIEVRKKSIKRFKKSFKRNFQANIKIAEKVRKIQSKTVAPSVIKFEPCRLSLENVEAQNQKDNDNFFMLTNQEPQEKPTKSDIKLLDQTSSLKFLHRLSNCIFNDQIDRSLETLMHKGKRIEGLYEQELKDSRLVCYIVDMKNLEINELKGQLSYLPKIINQAISNRKSIHLCLMERKQTDSFETHKLKYHQFIIGAKLHHKKSTEICSVIMQYCLALFLLMDRQTHSVSTTLKTSLMFFSNLCKFPKGFHKFISYLSEKAWIIRTSSQEMSKLQIKQIYQTCLQNFRKKENKAFEKSAAGLGIYDKQNRQQYFYICSLLSNNFIDCNSTTIQIHCFSVATELKMVNNQKRYLIQIRYQFYKILTNISQSESC